MCIWAVNNLASDSNGWRETSCRNTASATSSTRRRARRSPPARDSLFDPSHERAACTSALWGDAGVVRGAHGSRRELLVAAGGAGTAPAAPLKAGDRNLQVGEGGHQDARVDGAVLLAAEEVLALDEIVRDAVERTRSKLEYTALAAKFCPPEFTIRSFGASTRRSGTRASIRATSNATFRRAGRS